MKKLLFLCIVSIIFSSCYVMSDAASAARDISSRTLNADHILSNYEYYFLTFTELKSKVAMYNNYKNLLATTTDTSSKERMLVEQIGIYAYINDIVAQYNAKSKMLNRNLFKDKNLPFQVSFELLDGGKGILREGE